MITFETIRTVMSEEKKANKLTELPENFFQQLMQYLENKSKMKGKEESWEFESAKRLLQDILEMRERKLSSLALYHVRSGILPGKLMPEEQVFFDEIVKSTKEFQEKMKEVLMGSSPKMKIIALLEDTPEFVCIDMKNYGPFKKGDITTIPEENAKLLLEKGIAKEVDS
jgi:DNA replication initiation complex subunit (GINS family)